MTNLGQEDQEWIELKAQVLALAIENAASQDCIEQLRREVHELNSRLGRVLTERSYFKNRVEHLEKLLKDQEGGQEKCLT